MPAGTRRPVIWDWPVRLVHWLFVVIVLLLWWTAEQGMMDWHKRLGLAMFGLLLFRLTWGICGSWTARFWPMIRRLGSIGGYMRKLVRGQHRPSFGHNPLGVLSVFVLLIALCVQVGTGLFAVDVDGLESGPLSTFVSFGTGRDLAEFHELNFDILSVFITLHVAAILAYQFVLKDKLIGPMISGRRAEADLPDATVREIHVRVVPLAVALLVSGAGLYLVVNAG